ncbi:hypothetical protein C8R45DRAFT_1221026 [Mycena sanguinolenta]|nr:hypothetical protein C8R45DRAFT_1221026 [Mycena sanguinolenta]
MAYPFVLSQQSISQGRNMFLFCFRDHPLGIMNGGWNLAHHKMTIQTFYRWLDIIDDHYRDRSASDFRLRLVKMRRFDVLRYVLECTEGPSLPRDSVELLQPGVYGPFIEDEPYQGKVGDNFSPLTFRGMEQGSGRMGEELGQDVNRENKMPQHIIDAVTTRDGGVCSVTGRTDTPTSIIWIFPPSLAYMSYQRRDSGKHNLYERYRTVDNAITLCTSLMEPFMENMFSVDIEDNNHIVTFCDVAARSPRAPSLPSHVSRFSSPASAFWYLNFKWTLRFYFTGGDVSFEEHDMDPDDLMDDLVEDRADLTDEKWQSGVGAEVLAEFMEQTLCVKRAQGGYGSDNEFDEGSVGAGSFEKYTSSSAVAPKDSSRRIETYLIVRIDAAERRIGDGIVAGEGPTPDVKVLPIPSGRISLRRAYIRWYASTRAFLILGAAEGVLPWATLWVLLTIAENFTAFGKHWFTRNAIFITFGTLCIMQPMWVHFALNNPREWQWVLTLSALSGILLQVQDFRDIVGDRATGRNMLPLALGERSSRRVMAVLFALNALFTSVLAYRILQGTSKEYDHQTYMMFTYLFFPGPEAVLPII